MKNCGAWKMILYEKIKLNLQNFLEKIIKIRWPKFVKFTKYSWKNY